MSNVQETFDWYYVGHYGQLGPLSANQMIDLIQDGVIERDTYVWRSGMADWVRAWIVPEFSSTFAIMAPSSPPPVPSAGPPIPPAASFTSEPTVPYGSTLPPASAMAYVPTMSPYEYLPASDRSKILGGVLQLIIPGVGRMYMGYLAHGILQLLTSMCFGLGYIWSVVDGVMILTGSVKLDGYGRRLKD